MSSNYIIQLTQSSCCPNCNNLVHLLCDKDGREGPAFYICWNCRFIGEIGKGPVAEEIQTEQGERRKDHEDCRSNEAEKGIVEKGR